MHLFVIVSIILMVSAGWALAQQRDDAAQDTAHDLARELRQTLDQLQALRQQRIAQQQAFESQRDSLERQRDRLEQQADALRPQVEVFAAEVQALEQREQRLAQATAAWDAALAGMSRSLKPVVLSMRSRIEHGIPFEREARLQVLDAVQTRLTLDPEEQTQALLDWMTWAGEEWLHATERTLSNQPLSLAGLRKHAYTARLGLVVEAAVTEDQSHIALTGQGTPQWQLDLVPTHQQALIEMLDILRGRRPPALIALPMIVSEGNDTE